jgi:ubiquinone/menaquinone biosynthesis C-methylase UbiE
MTAGKPVVDTYSALCGRSARHAAVRHAYRYRLRLVEDMLRRYPGGTVLLDVGSGSGDYAAEAAATFGLEACLLDMNPERLAAGQAKGEKLRGVRADAAAFPFRDETFDYVLAMNSLRYVASPGKALAECRRVLRPGGPLVIIDHNRHSPETWLGGREKGRCFTAGQLTGLVEKAGFSVIQRKMLFMMPSFTPGFLVGAVSAVGRLLTPLLGGLYAEIFVAAVRP